jgi:uncharacterized protein (DUF433 family)
VGYSSVASGGARRLFFLRKQPWLATVGDGHRTFRCSQVTLRKGEYVVMVNRITFDPQIMGGRACIRGMWITVSLVVNLVANGMTTDEILREYPALESEDIRQALQYAASLAGEEIRPLTGTRG